MKVATVVNIGVLTVIIKHFYSFNREKDLQKSDGPIGLRSTCEVARITMNMWNVKWMDYKKVEEHYPEG